MPEFNYVFCENLVPLICFKPVTISFAVPTFCAMRNSEEGFLIHLFHAIHCFKRFYHIIPPVHKTWWFLFYLIFLSIETILYLWEFFFILIYPSCQQVTRTACNIWDIGMPQRWHSSTTCSFLCSLELMMFNLAFDLRWLLSWFLSSDAHLSPNWLKAKSKPLKIHIQLEL